MWVNITHIDPNIELMGPMNAILTIKVSFFIVK